VKLRPEQLAAHLRQGLAPVYVLSGDEPLQLQEAADAIRAAARAAGHTERRVLHAEPGFDWSVLSGEAAALSLFAERRLLDLRLPSGKPGKDGARVLAEYARAPAEDTVLLLQLPKMARRDLAAAWLRALERAGVLIQVWPLNPAQTLRFVGERLQRAGFRPDRAAVRALTERVEGNLLAAVQEIEKLALLREPGPLGAADVLAATADSARYDPFELSEAALRGDRRRCLRVLRGLQGEGVHPSQVLWALARDVRILADYSARAAAGHDPAAALRDIWQREHQGLLRKAAGRADPATWRAALARCAAVDRCIKGLAPGNPWDELLQLAFLVAGQPLLRPASPAIAQECP